MINVNEMNLTKKSIYIVEDNDDIRELIAYLLTVENYDVRGYPTVKSFKDEMGVGRPDLIILDVMLTDGNGIEVCDELKKNIATQNIPILMMSAHARFGELAKRCDADAFIEKPFDIDDLVTKVGSYMH